jgi:uncharacterized membrane protein
MENRLVYSPFRIIFVLLLLILLFVVVGLLFLDLARTAFTRIGFSWEDALLVLLLSLLGSGINIPVKRMECSTPVVRDGYVRAFGVTYKVPVVENVDCGTMLAVNVGGAVIPAIISLALMIRFPEALMYALAAVAFVALVVNRVARPVKGLGIVTPALLPPLVAALAAMVLTYVFGSSEEYIFLLAYVGGTLGTLLGADILNLNKIRNLGAPVASIGGAGTFDGVFLTGLIAVLLV